MRKILSRTLVLLVIEFGLQVARFYSFLCILDKIIVFVNICIWDIFAWNGDGLEIEIVYWRIGLLFVSLCLLFVIWHFYLFLFYRKPCFVIFIIFIPPYNITPIISQINIFNLSCIPKSTHTTAINLYSPNQTIEP